MDELVAGIINMKIRTELIGERELRFVDVETGGDVVCGRTATGDVWCDDRSKRYGGMENMKRIIVGPIGYCGLGLSDTLKCGGARIFREKSMLDLALGEPQNCMIKLDGMLECTIVV